MIFAAAAALVIAILLLTLFIRKQDLPQPEPPSPTAHLEDKKKTIYEGLRDLQFEYRMNKLSDEDYQTTKLDLQRQLAEVLAEIEKIQALGPKAAAPAPAAAAAAAPSQSAAAVSVCPSCGAQFPQPMKFCGQCGKAIPAASQA